MADLPSFDDWAQRLGFNVMPASYLVFAREAWDAAMLATREAIDTPLPASPTGKPIMFQIEPFKGGRWVVLGEEREALYRNGKIVTHKTYLEACTELDRRHKEYWS